MLRRVLPQGRPLPDSVWAQRHRAILALLWLHAVGLAIFGLVRGKGVDHALVEGGALALIAVVASRVRGRRLRSGMAAFGLILASAVFVHLSGGVVEVHFHFFVMVAVLTLYQEWLPFLVAIGFVVLHHGVVGALDPDAVYNHQAAIDHPWRWAAIHGGFVLAASVANLTAWRLNEESRTEVEESYRRLHHSESRYRGIVETAQEGVWLLDGEGRTTFVNSKTAEMLGVAAPDMLGRGLVDFVDPVDAARVATRIEHWVEGPVAGEEFRFRRSDDTTLWCLVAATPMGPDATGVAGALAMVSDITDRKAAEEALVHQAFHDTLTGLANRALFLDRVGHALSLRNRQGLDIAVLFLDLDRFKTVNDTLGHGVGDQLLVEVARRLESVVRPGDTVCRLGGDEFVVLCEELRDEHDVLVVAERVAKAVGSPVVVGNHTVGVTASIGIAFASTATYETADALLRDADAAMYRAKEAGRDGVEVFDPDIRARALDRLEAEAALRGAIDHDELVVHYQPVVALASAEVVGVEALVRWERPGHGLVPPVDFIPLAEESGLIVPLGAFVLRQACHQVAAWNRQRPDGPALTASVNLSARQLSSPGLVELVTEALSGSGLEPSSLCLEITESVLMEDAEAVRGALEALKRLGLNLAVDDFGTGYSSLLYLRRFPVDGLKVDRSFVAGLGDSAEDSAIVAGVVGLAHALGISAVAEGVETPEQARSLKEMGCALAQGFHWSKAMAPEELERWLEGYRAAAASAPPTPIRVMVVDDHANFRAAACAALVAEGCFDVVAEAADAAAAIELARLHQPDLVLLDLIMPGVGGIEALPSILEAAPAAKVAFLTALDASAFASTALLDAAGSFDKADLTNVVSQLASLVGRAGPKAQCFPIAPLSALAPAKDPGDAP